MHIILARHIFVLAKSGNELISIAVEGKVKEEFGPTVGKKREDSSPGVKERLDYLCNLLGITGHDLDTIRYQLLHRTASALIETERFSATARENVREYGPNILYYLHPCRHPDFLYLDNLFLTLSTTYFLVSVLYPYVIRSCSTSCIHAVVRQTCLDTGAFLQLTSMETYMDVLMLQAQDAQEQ